MQILSLPLSNINTNLEVGDIVYFTNLSTVAGTNFQTSGTSNIIKFGLVVDIDYDANTIQAMYDETVILTTPGVGDYLMFEKNSQVNSSNLLGYYADVMFVNNSEEKIELFSIGSEVSESSK
tara:strand:- start:5900 stop:6265 length:366 start_codon:yes stop_codon:yes gene_type:complete